jgi:hypothetical protein
MRNQVNQKLNQMRKILLLPILFFACSEEYVAPDDRYTISILATGDNPKTMFLDVNKHQSERLTFTSSGTLTSKIKPGQTFVVSFFPLGPYVLKKDTKHTFTYYIFKEDTVQSEKITIFGSQSSYGAFFK